MRMLREIEEIEKIGMLMCVDHLHVHSNTHTPKFAVYWSNTGTALRCAEMDSGPVPLPNEKSLREKKRKLEETLNGVVKYLVSLCQA